MGRRQRPPFVPGTRTRVAHADPLNPEEPYQLFPQAPAAPSSEPPAPAPLDAIISAQPQLRDLHKELTTLVPTAVRRKLDTTTTLKVAHVIG